MWVGSPVRRMGPMARANRTGPAVRCTSLLVAAANLARLVPLPSNADTLTN